jgi:uncharacterized protein (DUF1330 family)
MSCYFVALITIHEPERYAEYLDGFDAIFSRYQGEVLAVEDEPVVLEGEWPAARTVIIRFPSDEELLRWYRSPEYQRLAELRRTAADGQIALIRGLE